MAGPSSSGGWAPATLEYAAPPRPQGGPLARLQGPVGCAIIVIVKVEGCPRLRGIIRPRLGQRRLGEDDRIADAQFKPLARRPAPGTHEVGGHGGHDPRASPLHIGLVAVIVPPKHL